MKYPLGHAIIEWKDGGHSKALFYNDRNGVQHFVCSNWISGPYPVKRFEHMFENVITDSDDIILFIANGDY